MSHPHPPALALLIGLLGLGGCRRDATDDARPTDKPRPGTVQGRKPTPKGPMPKGTEGHGAAAPAGALQVRDISFAGPAGHRDDAVFARGEHLVALMSVRGFVYKGGRGKLIGTVELLDSSRRVVLRQRDLPLLDGKAPTARPGELRAAARVVLDPALPPGTYRVALGVEDKLSGRRGRGEGTFRLVGEQPPPATKALTITRLRSVGEGQRGPDFASKGQRGPDFASKGQRGPDFASKGRRSPDLGPALAAGSVMPLALSVSGLAASKDSKRGRFKAALQVETTVVDARGKTVHTQHGRALRRSFFFPPTSSPLAFGLALPPELEVGKYRARVVLRDAGQRQAQAELPFSIVAPRFAIVSPHLHDTSRLPRSNFRFGEQAFLRLSVQGFAVKSKRARLAIDLAVSGPGGVYLARKNAAQLSGARSATWARVGRFPIQLPLRLPSLAPVGSYKVLIRARDLLSKRTISRQFAFHLNGKAPKPLSRFAVDALHVRLRPDLPRIKGDTFVGGHTYHLTVRAGGGRPKQIKRATYALKIEGTLRLRSPIRGLIQSWKGLFHYDRTLNYRPLRMLLSAPWKVPANLPRGLYDLEIELVVPATNRVSTLRKRVEIRPGRSR